MSEIKVKYNTISPRHQERRIRFQLIGASICIIIGYFETFNVYTGITIILPLIGFALAFLNLLFARFYRSLVQKYGEKLELILLRNNGIIMLITGIGFQIAGSKYIQYAYFLLSILYFIILPNLILPAKKKKLVLILSPSKLIVRNRIRLIKKDWQTIDNIWIQNGIIKIKQKGHKKIKQYFIEPNDEKQTAISAFIENIRSEKGFDFKIEKMG
jgi:hypothetical protein